MSIGSIFSIARTAMSAHQAAVQVAGHNIANAETAGYSRQVGTLVPNESERSADWLIGTGVSLGHVRRQRDETLDASFRGRSSDASASGTRRDLLGAVEEVLAEPSDDGLAAKLDAFWGAWGDLASNPSSTAARSVVQQRGAVVAATLNQFDAQFRTLRDDAKLRLSNSVQELNGLADQIASTNVRIVESEAGGARMANDLRDARDLAIDKLSKLGDVRVVQNTDGSVQVLLGTSSLVDGADTRRVTLDETGGTVSLRFARDTEPMRRVGGSAQAMVDFLNRDLADATARLDALAQGLVATVNATHRLGQTFDAGGTPTAAGDFFHPGDVDPSAPPALLPVKAATVRLADAVRANAAAVAASKAVPGPGQTAGPGNNEIALSLAGLRTAANTVSFTAAGGATIVGSFSSFYRDMAGKVGTEVQDAAASATVAETLAEQTDRRRTSISGVNVDEELTTLMRSQQAYAAAAKVITIAEELMRTVVEMV